jgi:hypothetical protein
MKKQLLAAPDGRLGPVHALATAYLEQARAMTYEELRARQDAPYASLALGAAGLAYFFWRAAVERRDDALLELAHRWARAATRAPLADFVAPGLTAATVRGSLYYGPDGALFARILVAHARGKRSHGAVQAFRARCGDLEGVRSELLLGVAGYLTGALALHEETGDTELLAAADRAALTLMRRRAVWSRMTGRAFAHGRAGIVFSLLRWLTLTDTTLHNAALRARMSASVARVLERLACDPTTTVERARTQSEPFDLSTQGWCNGAGGMVHLWMAAYAWRPDPAYAARARACGLRLLTATPSGGADLCCGAAGRSYALLALDALEPHNAWRDAAVDAGVRAMEIDGPWPNGVLNGFPGLVMLAWDLEQERGRGFPLVGSGYPIVSPRRCRRRAPSLRDSAST